ncbi:hypothetical protein [Streptococcus ruminantium]|uniref:hypothetical protein n=1 Tax=Streptococcus ruminantium TaxID=1917441 RepID=UPI001F1E04A3|nr:hypothetical protein [Streptococcus ruminantium]BDD42839.1 hypothetical protein GUT189_11720 [Streptococcus ruminantium]
MDTVVDAAQGGNTSPASIGTNLAINAITEGVSSKTIKGQKGEVSSYKDALPVQQVSRPDKSTPKTDFYVTPDGTTLPATGYRYMDSKYAKQTMESMQAPGGYVGFTKFDLARQVQDAYQISPIWSDAKLRGEFDTLQIFYDARIPRAYGDKAGEVLAPLNYDML